MSEESKNENYPGNSHRSKEEKKKEPEKLEKVIEGEVIHRKKPLGRKIAETFAGDDAKTVGSYILFDVVIPALKDLIVDSGKAALDRAFYGESSTRSSRINSAAKPISYHRMFESEGSSRKSREISKRARAVHDFDELIFKTRAEPLEVLERLGDRIDNYDIATVSDLYELVGVTGSYTDDKYGWDDIRSATIQNNRHGYLLNMPKPKPID